MTVGLASLFKSSWRPNGFVEAEVHVTPANFGGMGSENGRGVQQGRVKLRQVGYALNPHLLPYNFLLPVVWKLRDMNAAQLAQVAARAPYQYGTPVTYTPPATASLLFNNQTG